MDGVDVLAMYTIYQNPSDYPGRFVVRRCHVGAGGIVFDPQPLAVVDSLEAARETLDRSVLVLLPRHPGDEPQIVETWV